MSGEKHREPIKTITIEIPEKIVSRIKLSPKRAKKMLMEELVILLYGKEIITSAQGSALLKKDRISFERFLAKNEIPIHGSPDELVEDMRSLDQLL